MNESNNSKIIGGKILPGKTVAQKLWIKENYSVLFVNEPKDYKNTLGELPANVKVLKKPKKDMDFIQVFVNSKKEMEAQLNKLKPYLKPKGLLWVTYPKGSSKIKVDINRDIIWKYAESVGLKAVSMISVDDTWSAMRLKVY